MTKILVLGATGFLGKHLIKKLEGHDISCLVRQSSDISHLKGKNLIYGDITNSNDLINAAKGQKVIINLTAPNTQDYETNRRVIVDGGRNILIAAKKAKVRQIIHLSSAVIYRKNLDNYGKAKKEADNLFINSVNPDLSITILRPTMIYGRGGYIAKKLFSSTTKIPFFVLVIGNGKNRIQPVIVDDVVSAIIASINLKPVGTKVFDLGGPYKIKYDSFIRKILRAIHKKKIIIHIPVFLIIFLVKIMSLFVRNLAFNSTTIKRMLEEIDLNIDHTVKELKIKITDYDEALNSLI